MLFKLLAKSLLHTRDIIFIRLESWELIFLKDPSRWYVSNLVRLLNFLDRDYLPVIGIIDSYSMTNG